MKNWRAMRGPVLAGTIAALMALGCLAVDGGQGGAALIWLPAGISVAAFYTLSLILLPRTMQARGRQRQTLQRELIASNRQTQDSLALFALAEEAARIGRWRLDLETQEQDWSPGMLEIHGLPQSLATDPGALRRGMEGWGKEIFEQIDRHREVLDTYSLTYRVRPTKQLERVVRMAMRNVFDQRGKRVAVFGVAMDMTDQFRREEALEVARKRAMRLATQAQKLANTDPLTALPNRRCTLTRLESMVLIAENAGELFGAILFDIDHFTSLNVAYGLKAGDEIIARVAEIAVGKARKGDVLGRVGGARFAWLLADTPEVEVHRLADCLREAVEKGFAGTRVSGVTLRTGVAFYRCGDTLEVMLERANAALHDSRGIGRNRARRAA